MSESFKKIHFSEGSNTIDEIIKENKLDNFIKDDIRNEILKILSKLFNYEEEEEKIIPEMIIGKGVKKYFSQMVLDIEIIDIQSMKYEKNKLIKLLKTIIPFCKNEWIVYIDFEDDIIQCGVLREISNITKATWQEQIISNGKITPMENCGIIYISLINKYQMRIHSIYFCPVEIDISFFNEDNEKNENIENIEKLSKDVTKDIENQDALYDKAFKKLFNVALKKVHGTILIVVKYETKLDEINEFKKDCVYLTNPIDITSYMELALNDSNNNRQRYYIISGLLLEMMNIDGACIIDTRGRVLAYNVFVDIKNSEENVIGGARKRAYTAICSINNKNIVGVYFQSQDGEISYTKKDGE